jgi:multiple sugar transport system permease protein
MSHERAAMTTTTNEPILSEPRRRRITPGTILLYAVLLLIALFFVLPLLWMLSTALKFESAVFTDKGFLPQNLTFDNFARILTTTSDTPVFRWMLNSFVVATAGTVLTVVLTSLSAYAFARIDFPGRGILFALLITTLLLPGVMFLIPQFVLVDILGLLNTYPGMILPGLAGVFGVFFMRQFFMGIPIELEEAAYVDGANRFRTFVSVVLPLALPAIATLAVISFLAYWNDYLWPLIICQGDGCTLPAGLRNFQSSYTAAFGLLMAGATLAAIPVLVIYVFAQRWIVQSVTSSGVKG